MEARLLKDKMANNCDYLMVSLDDQSFTYLNDGMPVRMAFFVDNNEDLPWFKRKTMVAIVGKNLDFDKHKVYSQGIFNKGLVDKSYLIDYINKMKKKLIQMAMQELEVLDIPGESVSSKAMIDNLPEVLGLLEENPEDPKEYINSVQAAELLNISSFSLVNLVKRGQVAGQREGSGWVFLKSRIEKLLKDRPEFMVKIWNNPRSYYKSKPKEEIEITLDNEIYVHIKKVTQILNLSYSTIKRHIELGNLKFKKEGKSDYYVPKVHLEELKANPPYWLKKSWSYFARKE